jgi:hypothetical protein
MRYDIIIFLYLFYGVFFRISGIHVNELIYDIAVV